MIRYILIVIFILSCSSAPKEQEIPVYQTSGVESFFLPNIPQWINFSKEGMCNKTGSVQYLDFLKLNRAYNFTRKQAVDLQIIYNFEKSERANSGKELSPNFESVLFFEILEKVKSGVTPFELPQYPQVNLAWIDLYLGDPSKIQELINLIQSSLNEAPIVIVSLCLDSIEMKKFLSFNFPKEEFVAITQEAFSIYGLDFKPQMQFQFVENDYFREKKIKWITPLTERIQDVWINGTDEIKP